MEPVVSCISFFPPSWRVNVPNIDPSSLVSGKANNTATLSDIFPATTHDMGGVGFALAHIPRNASPVLWVQDRMSCSQTGQMCIAGLDGVPVLRVQSNKPVDALWAMEEGLYSGAVSAVIGEIWGDPPVLDFTATKRLALRSHAKNIPVWLIRWASAPNLSAARDRWRISSLPAAPHPEDPKALGDPCWQVELFRSRTLKTGTWIARYDRAAHHLHLSPPFRNGAVADTDFGIERQAAG